MDRRPAYALAAPNVYFGRRLTRTEAREARSLGLIGVLDLACEFAETPEFRELRRYCSLPTLDATALSSDQLRKAIDR
jgi:hypothetical protein